MNIDIYLILTIINSIWQFFTLLFMLYKFTSFFNTLYKFIKFIGKSVLYIKNKISLLYIPNNNIETTGNITFYGKIKNKMKLLYSYIFNKEDYTDIENNNDRSIFINSEIRLSNNYDSSIFNSVELNTYNSNIDFREF